MLTVPFPKTAFRVSSALMLRLFLVSCSLFFLMYAQSFLTTSVRGRGLLPTTLASWLLGVSSFMKALLAIRFSPLWFRSRHPLCMISRLRSRPEASPVLGQDLEVRLGMGAGRAGLG